MVEKRYNEDADRYIFIDEDNAENLIELEKWDAENCGVLIDAMEGGARSQSRFFRLRYCG